MGNDKEVPRRQFARHVSRVRPPHLVLLAISIVVWLTYAPVLFSTYGYVDDYSFLQKGWGLLQQIIEGGRPLSAFCELPLFSIFHSVPDLSYVRLFGLFAAIVFAWTLFVIATRQGLGLILSGCYAVSAVTLPPYQIYVAWAVLAVAPLASAAAAFSAYLAFSGQGRYSAILSGLLFLTALLIYQPAAMSFFSVIPLVLYSKDRTGQMSWGRFKTPASVALAALSLAFLFIKLSPVVFYGGASFPRATLTSHYLGKARWFFSQPLPHAASLYVVPYIGDHLTLLALWATILVLASLGNGKSSAIPQGVLFLALIPLSYMPNLAVHGNWASNRTLAGLELLLLTIFLLASDILNSLSIERFGSILLIGLTAYGAFVAQYNIMKEFVGPNSMEWAYVINSVRDLHLGKKDVLCVKRSSWHDSLAPFTSYDDFGIPAGYPAWSARGIVHDAWQSTHERPVHIRLYKKGAVCSRTLRLSEIRGYRTAE